MQHHLITDPRSDMWSCSPECVTWSDVSSCSKNTQSYLRRQRVWQWMQSQHFCHSCVKLGWSEINFGYFYSAAALSLQPHRSETLHLWICTVTVTWQPRGTKICRLQQVNRQQEAAALHRATQLISSHQCALISLLFQSLNQYMRDQ